MTDATPYTVPKEPGSGRALAFAALVHAALFVFLWIGVQWQNETPVTIEAEVWSPEPREAAPQPEPVKTPEPEKPPVPEPKPVVKEPPKPKVEEPPVAKPDIALEQEKKRKAEQEKKRLEEERLAKEKEKKRLEQEKLAKLEEAKRIEKEKAEKARKEAAEKQRRLEEAEAKMLAKVREEEMRRLTGGVTGTGGSGSAPKSQGGRASAEYGAKIAAKIKSNTIYVVPENLAGNPPVEYAVELLPDGTLRSAPRKLRSSGIAGFDEAVLRAIDKSQPFPRDDKTGTVPSSVTISHKPKDQ
ncbi:MAG TPA: cell envelope integrity protein TolA [Noviherbaspirillum sp.]